MRHETLVEILPLTDWLVTQTPAKNFFQTCVNLCLCSWLFSPSTHFNPSGHGSFGGRCLSQRCQWQGAEPPRYEAEGLKQPGNIGKRCWGLVAIWFCDTVTGQKVCTQSDASVLNAKERFHDICPTNYEASVGLPAHEVFAEIDEDGSGTIDRHEPLSCIQPGHHAHQTWKHHLWFRHVLNRISWAYVNGPYLPQFALNPSIQFLKLSFGSWILTALCLFVYLHCYCHIWTLLNNSPIQPIHKRSYTCMKIWFRMDAHCTASVQHQFQSIIEWANALVPPTPFSGRSGGERSKRPTSAPIVQIL